MPGPILFFVVLLHENSIHRLCVRKMATSNMKSTCSKKKMQAVAMQEPHLQLNTSLFLIAKKSCDDEVQDPPRLMEVLTRCQ